MTFLILKYLINNFTMRKLAKMLNWEDLELTSSRRHTNITIYRANTDEKHLETSRKDILQQICTEGMTTRYV